MRRSRKQSGNRRRRRHLGVPEVADFESRGGPAIEQGVLELQIPVAHALQHNTPLPLESGRRPPSSYCMLRTTTRLWTALADGMTASQRGRASL